MEGRGGEERGGRSKRELINGSTFSEEVGAGKKPRAGTYSLPGYPAHSIMYLRHGVGLGSR